MFQKSLSTNAKKQSVFNSKNTLETLKDFGSSTVKKASDDFKSVGTGIFDQFFGNYQSPDRSNENLNLPHSERSKQTPKPKKEFVLFNYQEHYETEIVKREIKALSEQIKKEIDYLKKADASLLSEVKDIERISLEGLPSKPGIYHIRFFELVLSILRTLRAKVGESRTWLAAMISKKKKRGSLFAVLTKKKGTQYSLSQELQSARSIQ